MDRRFSLLLFFCACAHDNPGLIPAPTSAEDALAALQKETGYRWTVRFDPDTGSPAFLDGRTKPLAATIADAERSTRQFVLEHPALFRIDRAVDSLTTSDADADELGMIHVRMQQRKGAIPVWGGELLAHFADDGSLRTVSSRLFAFAAPSTSQTLSASEARVRATADARSFRPGLDPSRLDTVDPTLWLYPISAMTAKLAYRVEVDAADSQFPLALEVFVDAQTGEILHRANLIDTLTGVGIGALGDQHTLTISERNGAFWLEDPSRGSPAQKTYGYTSSLPGSEVKSADPSHWDEDGVGHGAAVDAHAYVAFTYDYFAHVHGRAGWDGKGKGIRATVHFGEGSNLAFYNGHELVFGDGDGENFSPLSAALDIVAHEYAHGVIAATAALGHEGETGALNEAIADIFAAFVTYGKGSQEDWQIGESVYHPFGRPGAIRDLAEPYATRNPERMDQLVVTDVDQGGIHANSTIVSHAAYVMTQGDGSSGLGVSAAERIWYRALTRYLLSHARFADAADATISAARDLGSGMAETVRQAWVNAGVIESTVQ